MTALIRILTAALLLGGPGAFLWLVVGVWLLKRRHASLMMLASGAVVVSCGALAYLLTSEAEPRVAIRRPLDGSAVTEPWIAIEGTVDPPDAYVAILVHPKQDDGWWVQPQPLKGTAGSWLGQIGLGSSDQGAGDQFQVVAVAWGRRWTSVLRTWLFGYGLEPGEKTHRPPPLSNSEIITLWRTR
jgi:hypothetical protein